MARERLSMRNVREILRLRWQHDRTVREVARSVGASTGVVSKTEARARRCELTWAAVEGLSDAELEERMYGSREAAGKRDRPQPDPLAIHLELKKPGMTLELLHLEYLAEHPDGYRYTAFCDVYRKWKKKRSLVMRQQHVAGEKMFTDFSGKKPHIIEESTGERVEVELFVAVLGASNYTYAVATPTVRVADWVSGHVGALSYFEGVPEMTVPDQPKPVATVACKYEPVLHRTFAELGRHYRMAVVPARPGKAKDKAKVEVAVQIAQRWILARLRKERFYSLAELNARIAELLEDLNHRPMKKYGGLSRRELFDRVERAALRPLPVEHFEPSEWSRSSVGPDYHANIEGHFYSVPWELAHEQVDVRLTATMVELFAGLRRVAAHIRSDEVGGHTTLREHMHPRHRFWADKNPEQMHEWGRRVGPCTEAMVAALMKSNFNREAAFRSVWGLRSLADRHEEADIERACERALLHGCRSYKTVERILKLGLVAMDDDGEEAGVPIDHANVRGAGYYTRH
jgi:transposase